MDADPLPRSTYDLPQSGLKLHSTMLAQNVLRLSLDKVPVPVPAAGEVLVRMAAAPVHPADMLAMLGVADLAGARALNSGELEIPLTESAFEAARIGLPIEAGLEGSGRVVAAGAGAEHFLGERVAVLVPGLGAYGSYCKVRAADCLRLPDEIDYRQGAAALINPLTSLAMVETLNQLGRRALIHTAAASSLGQMLVRICVSHGIELVNVVRAEEQANLPRSIGARHVCVTSSPKFLHQLHGAIVETGARVAFDAIGGGRMRSILLAMMERGAKDRMAVSSPYGSSEMKQVFQYGRLDPSDTLLPNGDYGMRWSIGGWAMPPILDRAAPGRREELMREISAGLGTAYATAFGNEISLADMLVPDVLRACCRHATGGKYLMVMDAAA